MSQMEGLEERHVILKRIHCFCNCGIDNQIEKSDKITRKDIFEQTVKEINNAKQTSLIRTFFNQYLRQEIKASIYVKCYVFKVLNFFQFFP